MNKEIEDYLSSDETGFYDSDYGTSEEPMIYYHFDKNNIEFSDILIIDNEKLSIYSLPFCRCNLFDSFIKSLSTRNGGMFLKNVEEIKTLEGFLMGL